MEFLLPKPDCCTLLAILKNALVFYYVPLQLPVSKGNTSTHERKLVINHFMGSLTSLDEHCRCVIGTSGLNWLLFEGRPVY